ncbi:hypothetical protein EON62_02660 [archaeon]|nr:MAG: hypothetical protein EON62_02660 [archaeon]
MTHRQRTFAGSVLSKRAWTFGKQGVLALCCTSALGGYIGSTTRGQRSAPLLDEGTRAWCVRKQAYGK